ncbi:hypothetical protein [Flavobacterium hydrophilum]|uniref:Uncharacterized protein n=1 Tax=Flavobacterium hydrophilum TaxID=2211445 RepID=A0A2V4C1R9_9FLAO|nr:hypothetical protein [Flavobacterium hydrophilum]PXY45241.1 hypothetical protein DMB68_11155 [Flavobacterium hydrophilum]
MFTQIPINTLNRSVFNQISKKEINRLKKATKSFVANTTVFNQLLSYENYPINKKLAITNILEFLEYVDIKLQKSYDAKIKIPKSVFENYFTSHHYISYQEIFAKLNIIKVTTHPDGSFYTCNWKDKEGPVVKAKCKIYQVSYNYMNMKALSLIIPDQKKKILPISNELKWLDKRFVKTIEKVQINLLAAFNDEITEFRTGNINFNQLKCRLHRILQLQRRRKIKKGKNVNRIYHSLTNISKISRKHLNIPFIFLDVKNCQPLLLCALMIKDGHDFDLEYRLDCEWAFFYDQFKCFGNNDKGTTKRLLYRHVFFGFKPNKKINQHFKKLYPATWEYLHQLSKTDISLASKLQNLESELFNVLIPAESKHFFTLFDAIYFDDVRDAAELECNITKFFDDLGLEVAVEHGIN